MNNLWKNHDAFKHAQLEQQEEDVTFNAYTLIACIALGALLLFGVFAMSGCAQAKQIEFGDQGREHASCKCRCVVGGNEKPPARFDPSRGPFCGE